MRSVSSPGRRAVLAAVLAGMAFAACPAQAQDGTLTAAEIKSESAAKQIVFACKLYAMDNNGKYPPNLDALVPAYIADRSAFISPLNPKDPVGYIYTPGFTDTSDSEAIVLEDKFAPKLKHIRIVVHTDDSVQILYLL